MSDGDIAWDGDFFNIVSIDSRGIRVIDHTQLDTISVFRSAAQVPRAITRMQNLARATRTGGSCRKSFEYSDRRVYCFAMSPASFSFLALSYMYAFSFAGPDIANENSGNIMHALRHFKHWCNCWKHYPDIKLREGRLW